MMVHLSRERGGLEIRRKKRRWREGGREGPLLGGDESQAPCHQFLPFGGLKQSSGQATVDLKRRSGGCRCRRVFRDSHSDTLREDGLTARGLEEDLVTNERRGCHKRREEQSLELLRGEERGAGSERRWRKRMGTNMDSVESTEPTIRCLSHRPHDTSKRDNSARVILVIVFSVLAFWPLWSRRVTSETETGH
jgi:hypothetical protein